MPLTRTDIAALRRAQSILISHNGKESRITAYKKADTDKDPFDGEAQIACRTVLTKTDREGRGAKRICVAHIYYVDQTPHWQTIVGLLREGDELVAVWYEDSYTNGHSENAGLHGDALYMRVLRDDKRKYEFLVAVSMSSSDSTARMIRAA